MKEMKHNFVKNRLLEELTRKQRINKSYSLRSFAKFLDVNVSTLSRVLNGTRNLPLSKASKVAEQLNLSPVEKELFLSNVKYKRVSLEGIESSVNLSKKVLKDECYFRVISEWEYFALLSLLKIDNIDTSTENISSRLNITHKRTETIINNLYQLDLIKKNDAGKWERTNNSVTSTDNVASSALKQGHKDSLKLAIERIDNVDIERRDYTSNTIAIDSNKIDDAKKLIREFHNKMATFMSKGKKDEVYNLSIQLLPLTNIEKLQ